MFHMIQDLRHHVQTAFGDFDEFFDSNSRLDGTPAWLPVQGIGQGNGCGPATWDAVSSAILSSLRWADRGLLIKAPTSGTVNRYAGFSFVDDTDTFENAKTWTEKGEMIIKRMQTTVTSWESLL